MIEGIYANIIIDISHEKVDRLFQYRIPKPLLGKIIVRNRSLWEGESGAIRICY